MKQVQIVKKGGTRRGDCIAGVRVQRHARWTSPSGKVLSSKSLPLLVAAMIADRK